MLIIDPREDIKHIGRGDSFKNALTRLHSKNIVDPIFVEIGTTRGGYGGGPYGDGWATLAWCWYANKFGGQVHTVDVDNNCLEQCRHITSKFESVINYHHMSGVQFLEDFKPAIDFLYLDGSDDPQEMLDEYNSAWLKNSTLILLDDIPENFLEAGKGRLVIPELLDNGWEMVYHDTTPGVMQMLFEWMPI